MLTPCRLYIASPDEVRLERLFSADARFFLLGGSGEGAAALGDILFLCPDAVVLDEVLLGLDGLEALRRMAAMLTPPRVVLMARVAMPQESVIPDETVPYPCGGEEVRAAALRAAQRALPALAAPWEETRMEIAESLLKRLGVPRRLKGRAYMQRAAAALACAPRLGESYSSGLYPYLAAAFGATPQAVERAIRTAVESTWLSGDLEAIQALFGLSVDADKGKPTNAECLAMLAEHVRREMARRMRKDQ